MSGFLSHCRDLKALDDAVRKIKLSSKMSKRVSKRLVAWILFRIPSHRKIEETNTKVNFIALRKIGFPSVMYFLISGPFISLMNIPLEFRLNVGLR